MMIQLALDKLEDSQHCQLPRGSLHNFRVALGEARVEDVKHQLNPSFPQPAMPVCCSMRIDAFS